MNNVEIYSKKDAHDIPWPDNTDSQKAKNFLGPMLLNGVKAYIENIETELYVIIINGKVLPLTVNHNDNYMTNSYVVSPYCNFILYAIKELKKLKQPLLEIPLHFLLLILGKIFRLCEINKVAIINNWMFSTNLFLDINRDEMEVIIQAVKLKFPNHTTYIRCISHMNSNPIYKYISKLNLTKIISRPIYYQNPANIPYKSSSIKKDRRHFKRSNYTLLKNKDIPKELLPQLREIYFKLYIKKYSIYNPQFTQSFFDEIVTSSFFESYVLISSNNTIDAGGVFYQVGNTITTPILGYDTDKPTKKGLYRLATYQTFEIGKKRKLTINRSSGAPHFKRCRRAVQIIEYNYVDLSNLTIKRKIPWLILNSFINPIAYFLYKTLKL